ncbi:MAG: substrate-binding domain-containing protein [Chloroflexi bacterium]|nr:substrate-binding domain-containing protein [Chloroflexota bacterium]
MHRSATSVRRLLATVGLGALLAASAPGLVAAQDASAPPDVNPYTGATPGSGEGKTVGYISLGDSLPFVKLVSDSIRAEAEIAGLELVYCDSKVDQAEALACAQQMKVQGAQAVLNFQLYAESSTEICGAYDNVPTIAIDIHQDPCEVVFMGADNFHAGEISGIATAQALQAENGCTYDKVLTLESPAVGQVNTDRVGGMLAGFASVCGEIPADKLQQLGVGGTTDQALESVTSVLPTIPPGGILVVLSLNDDMALGALAAARTAGRDGELRIGSQGADPSAWTEILCNPSWIADSAYFPERYGKTLVPAVIDLLDGKALPRNLFIVHEAISKDNLLTIYPEAESAKTC